MASRNTYRPPLWMDFLRWTRPLIGGTNTVFAYIDRGQYRILMMQAPKEQSYEFEIQAPPRFLSRVNLQQNEPESVAGNCIGEIVWREIDGHHRQSFVPVTFGNLFFIRISFLISNFWL